MPKFQVNDVIEPIERGRGFEQATVLKVFIETQGVHKGKEMYLLKIVNGTATVPIGTEVNYNLYKGKK